MGTAAPPTATATANDSMKASPSLLRTPVAAYISSGLRRCDLPADPMALFRTWLDDALRVDASTGRPAVSQPDAVTVSTASAGGVPSSRTVLLKGVDAGFVFFTSYTSRKSRELSANPYAALNFHWREANRQIRVVGRAEKCAREESEGYFASRPRASQVGTWASAQSEPVAEGELEAAMEAAERRWAGKEVPCPEHCGAWRVVPFEMEFWASQPSRLHDRFRYTRPMDGGEWEVTRLAP